MCCPLSVGHIQPSGYMHSIWYHVLSTVCGPHTAYRLHAIQYIFMCSPLSVGHIQPTGYMHSIWYLLSTVRGTKYSISWELNDILNGPVDLWATQMEYMILYILLKMYVSWEQLSVGHLYLDKFKHLLRPAWRMPSDTCYFQGNLHVTVTSVLKCF